MEELKQKIIERIDLITDIFEKRAYLGYEYDLFLQEERSDNDVEDFAQFVSEQKVRIQNFISSPIEDENIV